MVLKGQVPGRGQGSASSSGSGAGAVGTPGPMALPGSDCRLLSIIHEYWP